MTLGGERDLQELLEAYQSMMDRRIEKKHIQREI